MKLSGKAALGGGRLADRRAHRWDALPHLSMMGERLAGHAIERADPIRRIFGKQRMPAREGWAGIYARAINVDFTRERISADVVPKL
jgi:hypothetical protein